MTRVLAASRGRGDLADRLAAKAGAVPFCWALSTPEGSVTLIGEGRPSVHVSILNEAGMSAVRSLSELKICEAYIRGDIDFDGDLVEAMQLRELLSDGEILIKLWAWLKPVLVGRRRCNPGWIAKHYDSGNIQLMGVDSTFDSYTPGIYEADDDTLEDGALRKFDHAFRSLRLKRGDSLLDVGCGWGGFVRFCAERGVDATGITLSRHQLEHARRRLAEDGLDATVLYQDFFSFAPGRRYDAISMMGVLEDLSDYRQVLRRVAALLRPGGRVYCDFASSDRRFAIPSFITKYIWPGRFRMVYFPTFSAAIVRSGLVLVGVENDRRNYYLWARGVHDRWVERRTDVVAAAGAETWRMMRLLFAGTAHVMSPAATGRTAYRVVLESPRAPSSGRGLSVATEAAASGS
jgi:cyclopropane-fatty-acyl-phospholipid synthase